MKTRIVTTVTSATTAPTERSIPPRDEDEQHPEADDRGDRSLVEQDAKVAEAQERAEFALDADEQR